MKSKPIILLVAFFFAAFIQSVSAQSTYTINESKANDMKLSGTSSMHDWDMKTSMFTSEAQFDFKKGGSDQLTALNELSFSLYVENLKSDKSSMDKNAYKALKTDQYKNISYKLLTAAVSPDKENKFLVKTTGNLTIAGVTKEVEMDVFCIVSKDVGISCSGSEILKMTDYQVKPPSFMFGAMTTGDSVTLDFTVVYEN